MIYALGVAGERWLKGGDQMKLDEKGRCCGRKPLVYKTLKYTGERPQKYCPRCDRAFDIKTGEQIKNWAWQLDEHGRWYET